MEVVLPPPDISNCTRLHVISARLGINSPFLASVRRIPGFLGAFSLSLRVFFRIRNSVLRVNCGLPDPESPIRWDLAELGVQVLRNVTVARGMIWYIVYQVVEFHCIVHDLIL
jgi:hypothetical protein